MEKPYDQDEEPANLHRAIARYYRDNAGRLLKTVVPPAPAPIVIRYYWFDLKTDQSCILAPGEETVAARVISLWESANTHAALAAQADRA